MIEWVFALPEACSVTFGQGGVWLNRNDAFPIDDPFVLAHPEMFSRVPAKARSTDGRPLPEPLPLTAEELAEPAEIVRTAPRRGKAAANG